MNPKLPRRDFLKQSSVLGLALASPVTALATAKTADDSITTLSASELSAAIRSKQLTCSQVMQAYLDKIAQYNPNYLALVSLAEEQELMDQAALADRALNKGEYWGWLHGMPHAPKDLTDARGFITSYGSPLFKDNLAKVDSLPVARIRSQGAIFIGKTNTPEFGLGSHTYNSVFGTTKNAYNPQWLAGGSSGGAAVALAAQLIPAADGSDMMGSLRNPAAFNNIVGFRPSQGRVPSPSPYSDLYGDRLATDGPMGRTVEDTIRLFHTMAGYDSREPLSLRDTIPAPEEFRPADLSSLKIGWMGDYQGHLVMEPGVLELCETALDTLSKHGTTVEQCAPDFSMSELWETWLTLRHGSMKSLKPLYDDPSSRSLLKPELIWEIEGSIGITAERQALAGRHRSNWYRALHTLFENYDLLALPSAQVFPFDANIEWPRAIAGRAMDTYHRWMEVTIGGTLAGLPVVSMPAGFDELGRPNGIQFLGKFGQDRDVLEFALAYESRLPFQKQKPVLQDAK